MTINFNDLSDKDLERLFLDTQEERLRRANIRKAKLIENFKNAFNALGEAGYDVFVEGTSIFDFDEFEIQ